MESPTEDRILYLLKTRGPLRAADLAQALAVTASAARQQLGAMQGAGLVKFDAAALGRGRPKHVWSLTAGGHARFPDRHAEVIVSLIEGVRERLGPAALERLIESHEQRQLEAYRAALEGAKSGLEAMRRLARERSREGYMAEAEALDGGDVRLIEHHCPICTAARACQGFCRAELMVFAAVLAPFGRLEREDHLMAGARRCAYRLHVVAARV